jgi:putative toxin-antitoxin system antitoxin component (TIGR02293 family)
MSWSTFQHHVVRYPDLGFSLDLSLMDLPQDHLEAMAPRIARVFDDLAALESGAVAYRWSNPIERIDVIRNRVNILVIETMSELLSVPVKEVLALIGMPQTSYNKRKKENALLDVRDSEWVIVLNELIAFGADTFGDEGAFLRWLHKPNASLGMRVPFTLLDTHTGIHEVHGALERIAYGNLS